MQKVALIGCGTMGRTHANGYTIIPEAKVVAVCDLNKEKAAALAALSGAKVYDDYKTMMDNEDVDILDICLPTFLHKKYAVDAMKRGVNVFSEKPIALTAEDAEEMIATAKKCNVKFSVGHVVRYFPSYRHVKELADSGRLGIPRLIRTTRNQGFPGWSWENWYQDYSRSGGPIVDLVIHDFDWVLDSFGDVERVFASSFNGEVPGQEHCMCILRLKNGAMAHIEGSWAYPQGSIFRMTYEVIGTEGQVEYDSLADAPIHMQTNKEGVHQDAFLNPMLGEYEPYAAEIRAFVQAVENNQEPKVTGEQALKALKVALACIESSKTQKSVVVK